VIYLAPAPTEASGTARQAARQAGKNAANRSKRAQSALRALRGLIWAEHKRWPETWWAEADH
jgi:hypothetical protein